MTVDREEKNRKEPLPRLEFTCTIFVTHLLCARDTKVSVVFSYHKVQL